VASPPPTALPHLLLELPQLGLPPLHGLDLLPQLVDVRLVWDVLFPFIRLVQLLQVLVDLFLQFLDLALELLVREVAALAVLSFELASVYRHDLPAEQIELAAEQGELAGHLADGLPVVAAEVGDGFAEGPGQGSQA